MLSRLAALTGWSFVTLNASRRVDTGLVGVAAARESGPQDPMATRADRPLTAALWAFVIIGLGGAARLMWWYWPGSFFDGVTSDIWTALAWDFAHGELYRPLLGRGGYGGTRYMPLLFVVHGLLIRAHLDPVHAGLLLMQTSVLLAAVALFVGLRAAEVPMRLAVPLAGTVWCTVIYQQSCTDINPDYLAAAFAILSASLTVAAVQSGRPLWLVVASVVCMLAGLTKITAVGVAAPMTLWLVANRRYGWAARFALGTAVLMAAAVGVVQVASAGRFFEGFGATITGGMTPADMGRAFLKYGHEVAMDPFVAGPFVLAWCCALAAGRRGQLTFVHAYFATAALVTLVIFASPGTVGNHLVDLQMTSILVIGVAIRPAHVLPRTIAGTWAAMAVILAAISLPMPGIPSVIATLRMHGTRSRAVVAAVHAEFLSQGGPYLSTDPIVPVLNDERAVMLDHFNLERFVQEGTPAGLDVERRVHRHLFRAIVMRDTADFPNDMNADDPAFAQSCRKFWASQHNALARLFRSTYAVRAVRKPFLILTPTPREAG